MRIAVYPGSFDPITKGHLDIIKRASKMFDKVIVAVVKNQSKKPMFTFEERRELILRSVESVGWVDNIEVEEFQGLLVDFMHQHNSKIIVKGLRFVSDFEYEFQQALTNRKLDEEIETMFMVTCYKYSYLSSSIVKEICMLGGDVTDMLPEAIIDDVSEQIKQRTKK
ncbi:MAG: pantetheine-phosphate adenylyltransferase [Clostridiales bacterium]|nr:pantetheine-phosphate adenylyltransferase [Clostridiales bacterium]